MTTDFSDWIGRTLERRDVLTDRMAREFRATLGAELYSTDDAPLGLFWALAPDIEPAEELGPDGHPRLGLHLPPLPFARRMWAGGALKVLAKVPIGVEITKTSTIRSIDFKSGATGPLAFVAVNHVYAANGEALIEERQDIVYRSPTGEAGQPTPAPALEPTVAFTVEATPTLLFRYSALTFNGHRIHYDFPYATGAEGYAGLVVHGPMQATLMLNAAARALGRTPKTFRYRGHSPLIAGGRFRVEAVKDAAVATRVVSATGALTMSGKAD